MTGWGCFRVQKADQKVSTDLSLVAAGFRYWRFVGLSVGLIQPKIRKKPLFLVFTLRYSWFIHVYNGS